MCYNEFATKRKGGEFDGLNKIYYLLYKKQTLGDQSQNHPLIDMNLEELIMIIATMLMLLSGVLGIILEIFPQLRPTVDFIISSLMEIAGKMS